VAVLKRLFVIKRSDDLFSVHTFDDVRRMVIPWSQDSDFLMRSLNSLHLKPRGLSRFGTAINSLLSREESHFRFGDAIIVLSDGWYSSVDQREVESALEALLNAGVRVFLLYSPGEYNQVEVASMVELAETTGGRVAKLSGRLAPDDETIFREADITYDLIRSSYRLELEFSQSFDVRKKVTIDVRNRSGQRLKDMETLYPRRLPAAAPNR
jgi:hypothetical protein